MQNRWCGEPASETEFIQSALHVHHSDPFLTSVLMSILLDTIHSSCCIQTRGKYFKRWSILLFFWFSLFCYSLMCFSCADPSLPENFPGGLAVSFHLWWCVPRMCSLLCWLPFGALSLHLYTFFQTVELASPCFWLAYIFPWKLDSISSAWASCLALWKSAGTCTPISWLFLVKTKQWEAASASFCLGG